MTPWLVLEGPSCEDRQKPILLTSFACVQVVAYSIVTPSETVPRQSYSINCTDIPIMMKRGVSKRVLELEGEVGKEESSHHHDHHLHQYDNPSSELFSTNDIESTVFNDGCEGDEGQNGPNLGSGETKAVKQLKMLVIFILVGAAAAVASLAYSYTRNHEVSEFEETFGQYSQQIINTVQVNVQNKLEAIGALALQIQAYAINHNESWPFVTMPFFEEHVMASKSLIDAYGVLLFPIVQQEQRKEWEKYSVEHIGWMNDSYAAQRHVYDGEDGLGQVADDMDWFNMLWGEEYRNESNPDFSRGFATEIFKTVHDDPDNADPVVDDTKGPYFPQWQTAPLNWYYQSSVNLNYGHYEDFYNQTQIVEKTGTAAFGIAWEDHESPGFLSTMLYPVFDRFYDNQDGQKTVVAYLSIDIFWEAFLQGILPPNSDGIFVVIENTCDQVFTYELFGDKAEFVGEGDLHDSGFDDMMQSTVFGEAVMEPITSPTYTGRPLYDDFCPYTFRIYPSAEMETHYVTRNPIIYSIVIALVFVFTSIVFIGYDYLVERRQKVVVKSATRADALVSSLFPTTVKDRLYEGQKKEKNDRRSKEAAQVVGLENHLLDNVDMDEDVSPIADLYPATTIMFAGASSSYVGHVSAPLQPLPVNVPFV